MIGPESLRSLIGLCMKVVTDWDKLAVCWYFRGCSVNLYPYIYRIIQSSEHHIL